MKECILTVYFSGTDGRIDDNESLTSVFWQHTIVNGSSTFKMAFDGCGTDTKYNSNLDFGGIFTYGLAKQVDAVVDKVKMLFASGQAMTLTVNVYGFSRGGAASFLLAKKLNQLPETILNHLEINLAALEPVPGNLITTAKIDIAGSTLTNSIGDLSDYKIANMFLLYTNELLPHLPGDPVSKMVANAHTPLLPSYPDSCHATIDVLPGCHKSAQRVVDIGQKTILCYTDEAFLCFWRFKTFLQAHGTDLDLNEHRYEMMYYDQLISSETANQYCITIYDRILHNLKSKVTDFDRSVGYRGGNTRAITRDMHYNNKIETAPSEAKKYLNMHHKMLCNPGMDESAMVFDDIALYVEQPHPINAKSCAIS